LSLHANNLKVWRNTSDRFPHPYTLAIARHWVEQGHVEFGGNNWAIAFDDAAVGGAGIVQQPGQYRCNVEIGYWLGEPYWGRGVATEVTRVLTERAFAWPEVTRVFASVHADNPASMRVLQKNGYEREGLQRRSAMKNGVAIDRVFFAKIASGNGD
jgi:RimJ/RimL family protein N-acetyltransferase